MQLQVINREIIDARMARRDLSVCFVHPLSANTGLLLTGYGSVLLE